eukprot:jgi/Psemu1/34049/gm1.34049_g
MDIPNNNVNSDADSNISQILLLSDDDRKPSAQKDPPPADTSAKKKTLNLGSVLFSHQKNNAGFSSSSSSSSDNDSIKIPPNNKKAPPTNKAPNKKAPPNPRQEAMKALLIKKSSYTRGIKATFLVKLKGLSLSDLHQNKHSFALIKLLQQDKRKIRKPSHLQVPRVTDLKILLDMILQREIPFLVPSVIT